MKKYTSLQRLPHNLWETSHKQGLAMQWKGRVD